MPPFRFGMFICFYHKVKTSLWRILVQIQAKPKNLSYAAPFRMKCALAGLTSNETKILPLLSVLNSRNVESLKRVFCDW